MVWEQASKAVFPRKALAAQSFRKPGNCPNAKACGFVKIATIDRTGARPQLAE
jgi:hypothetical protein